jgi:hypothetical protein
MMRQREDTYGVHVSCSRLFDRILKQLGGPRTAYKTILKVIHPFRVESCAMVRRSPYATVD